MIRKVYLVFVLFCLSLRIYSQKRVDYLKTIRDYEDFAYLQTNPLSKKYAEVESVKALYDLKRDKVYFINGHYHELHYDFCYTELGHKEALPSFNKRNYSDEQRRFCLVNINYFKEKKLYSIEYNVSDDISLTNILMTYQKFSENFFDTLRVVLNNNNRIEWGQNFKNKKVPTVLPSNLFKAQKIQVINEGETGGKLVLIKNKEELFNQPLGDKIVLLDMDVLDMPNCRGIITNRYQTPLSHISLLAKNRGIPVVVNKDFLNDTSITFLIGKQTCLEVKSEKFKLQSCDQYKQPKKNNKSVSLDANIKELRLLTIADISLSQKDAFGTKCANLAELSRIRERQYNVPEGAFGIPFAYYKQHLEDNGIDKHIRELLADTSFRNNRLLLDEKLKLIRKEIKDAPINKLLLKFIHNKIDTAKTGTYFRFRSSSNAEDLKGFNGAGLYDSKTGIVGDEKKSIEKAVKKVWASVWTLRAFEEREIFNINQESVLMAILVHRSFPDEEMNGVAITANLYRDYEAGFVLNQQIGENRVVDNTEHLPEQLITYYNSRSDFFNDKNAIEYISTSDLNDNKPILSTDDIYFLTKELERIKRHFYPKFKGRFYKQFALDIEYKFAKDFQGNRQLYIKQVRLLSK